MNIVRRIKNRLRSELSPRRVPISKWHQIKSGKGKGSSLLITKESFSGWGEMVEGTFDAFWYEELEKRELSPSHVLDIGAHFGYHSICLSRMYREASIIAFEPNPINFDRLKLHVHQNALSNVLCYPLAVSDRNGQATFQISENLDSSQSTGSYLNSVTPPLDKEHYATFKPITVSSKTLDHICSEHNLRPDLIKIDIEGAEMLALRGGKQTIQENLPILCIEAHSATLKNEVISFLKSLYDIKVINEQQDRSFLFCSPIS